MSVELRGPPITNGNGNSTWRTALLGATWAALLAAMGWIATDAATARTRMEATLYVDSQRIAVLEEANRAMRESQARIEKTLEDIRREMQAHRR